MINLDLNALEALEAVVRLGGFARASEHLHKVQSAVSHQVRKIEDQLGIEIFDRAGYRVALTPAGKALLAESRKLLARAKYIKSMAKRFAEGWEPQLLVVLDGILPLQPFLSALKQIAAEQIPTRIQVRIEFLHGVQRRFEQDEGDLMMVADYTNSPHLREEGLPAMDCVLCVAPAHPLAESLRVDLEELQEYVEISVQNSNDEQRGDRHLFACKRSFYLSSFQEKKAALLLGAGFGWMPFYLIHEELKLGSLREVRYLGGSRYRFIPHLVHRTDRQLGPTAQRFAALIRNDAWPMHLVQQPKKERRRRIE